MIEVQNIHSSEKVHALPIATLIAACLRWFGLNNLDQNVQICLNLYIEGLEQIRGFYPEPLKQKGIAPKNERPGRDEARHFRSIGGTPEQLAEVIKLCKGQGLLYSQELQKLFTDKIDDPAEIVQLLTPKLLNKEADLIEEMDGVKARLAFEGIAQELNWPKLGQAPVLYCRLFSKRFGRIVSDIGKFWDDEWREAYRFILKVQSADEPTPLAITKWQQSQAVLPTNLYDHVYRGSKD